MTFWELLALAATVNLVVCGVLWLVSIVRCNVTVVDPFWGLGFCIVTSALFLVAPGNPGRCVLVMAMAWAWGLRYALHLYWRQWGHDEESTYYPYKQWRREAGERFWWMSAFRIFIPQAIGTTVVGLPLIIAMHRPTPDHLTLFDLAGVLVWAAGFTIEALADYQLASFKHDPSKRGQVMREGLWRYSRHPNYFGDSLVWWGFWLVAMSTPGSLLTIVSPAIMTFLLVRVSGVAMVESRAVVAGRPEYAAYVRETSAFVPWRPGRRR